MSIDYTVENHVARVTINRPDRLNSLDDAAEMEMMRIWGEVEKNRDVRVAIVTGVGDRSFCAGHDLKQEGKRVSGLEYWALPREGGYAGLTLRDTLDIPVIGRINGFALGGGLVLALGCDILVASSTARFGFTEPRVGRIALSGGVQALGRRIPHVHAMGMILTGRQISADEALKFDMINEVVPPDQLDAAVDRWVHDILLCAPLSLKASKMTLRMGEHLTLKESEMLRVPALVESLNSSDGIEGPLAFREKRAPKWSGK